MALSDWVEKLGRAVFEAPFNGTQIAKDAPELAEIRLAVLDEIKAKSHRVSGRDVFPYNLVRSSIGGVPEEQAGILKSAFFTQFLETELKSGLSRWKYRFPGDLQIEIETTPQLPGPKEQWLRVATESRGKQPEAVQQPRKVGRLVVLKGTANESEILLKKARTNLGRTVDVFRSDGPSRRNDLAFTEDDAISRSVSREHAHIIFNKRTGEYHIYNDRWVPPGSKGEGGCGVWIIRDGMSQEVHRNARGTQLQPGDEIHLGRAAVKFR